MNHSNKPYGSYVKIRFRLSADCAGTQRECEEGTTVCVGK